MTLREYDHQAIGAVAGNFSGREATYRIGYVTAFEQKPGWVVFSLIDNGSQE